MTLNQEIQQICFDNAVSIEKIIWLATEDAMQPSEAFEEFCNDTENLDALCTLVGIKKGVRKTFWKDEDETDLFSDRTLEFLLESRHVGFLVLLGHADREPMGKNLWSVHPGSRYLKWVYVDNLGEVFKAKLTASCVSHLIESQERHANKPATK